MASPARLILTLALAAGACKPPPGAEVDMPLADPARGLRAIERAECGACHTIEGLSWPQGETASELRGFTGRGLIAGSLPNRPDVLAAFVRDAPALVPGIAMPAMPLTEREARDIAAYLYAVGD